MNEKLYQALKDVTELHADVAAGTFLPKRFRKMPIKQFMEFERPRYLAYLEREIVRLQKAIRFAERNASYATQ